jgi:hypothetical protein
MRFDGRDTEVDVGDDQCVIGRAESLAVRMPSCPSMSREHLRVEYGDGKIWITDLGSSNGTFLGGRRVPPKTPIEYRGQELVVGDLEMGTRVWIGYNDTTAQTNKAMELSERIQLLQFEIAELEKGKLVCEEKQQVMVKRVEDLIFREVELFKSIDEQKKKIEEGMMETEFIEQTLKDWKGKKEAAEIALNQHEASIAGIQEVNNEEERLLQEKKAELEAYRVSLDQDRDQAKSRFDLDLEQLQVEAKLKRTQIENEIEELRSRKLTLERDLEAAKMELETAEQREPELRAELRGMEENLRLIRVELEGIQDQIPLRRSELKDLESMVSSIRKEIEASQGKAALIIQASEAEARRIESESAVNVARKIKDCDDEIAKSREEWFGASEVRKMRLEEEIRARDEQANQAITALKTSFEAQRARDREALELEMKTARDRFEAESKAAVEKFQGEQAALQRAWTEEVRTTKERDLQDVRLIRATEEQKMREVITDHRVRFAKQVSASALTKITGLDASLKPVMTGLEAELIRSIEDYARGEGYQVESHEVSQRRFIRKTVAWAAGSVAVVLALIYGPGFFAKKIDVLKAENAAANAQFMKDIREQRERMLSLKLEARTEFQESYVDNILYNPGYLSLKQDEAVQKEWTAVLSKFFFEVLLLDDQKVVNYVPVETSLVRALADINQVLNTANFEVNLKKMIQLEEDKQSELWIAAGSKDNWQKLRKREAEFYAEKVKSMGDQKVQERTPAGNQ